MDSQTKLKRVVIKQELVSLTGDHIKALILNQFLYWSERTKDTDKFIQEEKNRNLDEIIEIEPTFGWIYKTAEELSVELMLDMSASTIRRHLSKIVKAGYIDQRHNPSHKWDRTLQYRPNIVAIQTDLEAMGYSLEGYPLLQNAFSILKNGTSKIENRNTQNEGALPETTPETTTDINGSAKTPPKYSTEKKAALNLLVPYLASMSDIQDKDDLRNIALFGYEVAQVCKLDIALASIANLKTIARVTIALNTKKITQPDLKNFETWWYNEYWLGKDKNQPPTPGQLGDRWGQFEGSQQMGKSSNNDPILTDEQKAQLAYLTAQDAQK